MVMHELRPYLKMLAHRRRRLIIGAGLMLITILAVIGLLSLSGWFITATAITAALWAAGTLALFDVYIPGGGIRFFALTRTVARYFERLYNHDTVLRLLADLRGGLFAAFTRLDVVTLERLRAAELLQRLTADIDALDNLYLRLLAPPLVALLALIAVTVLISLFVPSAGFVVGAGLLLLLALLTVATARCGAAISERLSRQGETLRVRLIEQIQGLAELSAYGSLLEHRRSLVTEEAKLLGDQRRLGRQIAVGNAGLTLGVQLIAVLALLLGLSAFQSGVISGAVMVMLPLAIIALGEAFLPLPAAFAQIGGTRAAARRLTAEAKRCPELPPPVTPMAVPEQCDVVFESVTFRYPYAETAVLEMVDLHVAAGERVAVLGASGAGKSTVAQLVARLRDPTGGVVRLGGIDLRQLDPDSLRYKVAYLTQRTELFEDTIAANLRIAAPEAGERELWQALHVVALDELVRTLPEGLDTWIGESGRRLSGGEGRRLALARLLLRDPGVVLLDEPLSGLDAETASTVSRRMTPWFKGRAVLAFAHDLSALPGMDRASHLRGGKLEPSA
jgi:ATP-binding cassette, subfamily C, bacterial CydC